VALSVVGTTGNSAIDGNDVVVDLTGLGRRVSIEAKSIAFENMKQAEFEETAVRALRDSRAA